VSNVPQRDIIVPSAAELWSLLHLDRAKAVAQSNGRYKGRRIALAYEDLERHLAGDLTLGFTVLCHRQALFAVLDVDALFQHLLPVIRVAVLAMGGEDLRAAIFCTNGSDEGRGKIILTFTETVGASEARKLAQNLCRRVRASEPAQPLERHHLSAYPQEKSGGVVRVLGRNAARAGPIERPFSLDGELGLEYVRPITAAKVAQIIARIGDNIAPWAKRRIETAWMRLEGTDKHFGHMVALAREAIRIHGRARGGRVYNEWLDRIKANSPELSLPSPKTKDQRNVIDHARKGAWELAIRRPNSWEPLDLQVRKGTPRGVLRLYNALVSYVREKGLRPECFGIDYERIAFLIDSSKSTAHRWVQCAAETGVVVVHDRGTKHTKGAPGQCTRRGLVCRGQTQEQVAGLALVKAGSIVSVGGPASERRHRLA
jgi:hypothetical protein